MRRTRFTPFQRGGLDYFKGQQFQWGTGFPPYRNFQEGEGIGDIFRNVMRFILPILAPIATETASKFVSSTADAMREGKSLGQAAKQSIAPAIGQAMDSSTAQIMSGVKKFSQSGSGRRRRRRARSHSTAPSAKRARRSHTRKRKRKTHRKRNTQFGVERFLKKRSHTARKRVYKRRHKKGKSIQNFQSPNYNF